MRSSSFIDTESEIFLRITSLNIMKSASLYRKKQNMYEEKMTGLLQIIPEKESFKTLDISNLSRSLESRNIYYYENFNFTMKGFKEYIKKKVNLKQSNNSNKKISKNEIRMKFLETFTSKSLLNDFFLFCINHSDFKKSINFDFYEESTNEKTKEEYKKKIINSLLEELFKIGSIFYVNKNNNIEKNSIYEKEKTYNKYKIKDIDLDNIQINLANNTDDKIIKELEKYNKTLKKNEKILNEYKKSKTNKKTDYALAYIKLILDNNKGVEKSKNNTNNNNNSNNNSIRSKIITTGMLIKPKRKNAQNEKKQ